MRTLPAEAGSPERLLRYLTSRLKKHTVLDLLLLFFPPLFAFFYLAFILYRSGWLGQADLIVASAFFLGASIALWALNHRGLAPPPRFVARLIDEKVAGKDRFLTLTTIDPSLSSPPLLDRLRWEAARLEHRLDLKREFPYHIKRSFFASAIGSLAVIFFFQLFLIIGSLSRPLSPLQDLAGRLSRAGLSDLARGLEALEVRLKERGVSSEARRSMIQELLKKVEDRLAGAERQPGDKDLLAQAAQVLRGLEADPGKGEGMRDSGPGQEGKGTGSGEEHQDEGRTEASAIGDKKKREENSPGGEKVSDRGPGTGDRAGDRKLQQNREEKKENERMAQTGSEGRGRKEMRDEIRGPLPERFLKPGEAEKVLKGARFVTVELPEEEIAGEGGESVPGKRGRSRARLPVSNLPLRPPDSPDAPPEKQPLPLEYRGLIR